MEKDKIHIYVFSAGREKGEEGERGRGGQSRGERGAGRRQHPHFLMLTPKLQKADQQLLQLLTSVEKEILKTRQKAQYLFCIDSFAWFVFSFIIWLCLTRTVNYQIHEFDWLRWILNVVQIFPSRPAARPVMF